MSSTVQQRRHINAAVILNHITSDIKEKHWWRSAYFLHHWRGKRVCVWIIHNSPPPVVQQAARGGVCLFNLHAAPCLSVNTQVELPGDWVLIDRPAHCLLHHWWCPASCGAAPPTASTLLNWEIETQGGGVDVIHTVEGKVVQANRAASGRVKWLCLYWETRGSVQSEASWLACWLQ